MAIYRILQNSPLGPEEIRQIVAAYELALEGLGLKDRTDPKTELVAKKILEIRETGINDPVRLSKLAIEALGSS
jgi:hypothetical protein